jgi:hypothetical protein
MSRAKSYIDCIELGPPQLAAFFHFTERAMSAIGTSRHFAALQNLSAIGVTADMPNGFSEVKSSKREAAVLPGSYSLGHRGQKIEKVKHSHAVTFQT